MKCNHCRKPTEYILEQRRILCKLCKRPAPPTLKAHRCKHRFESEGVFSKECLRGCGVSINITDEQLNRIEEARKTAQAAKEIGNTN